MHVASGTYAAGRYAILTASSAISGTFGSLSVQGASLGLLHDFLSYDANTVFLVLTPGPVPSDTDASTAGHGWALVPYAGLRYTKASLTAMASLGLGDAQPIGMSLAYGSQPYSSTGVTSVQVRYTAGF
jgi:hypothetical protein